MIVTLKTLQQKSFKIEIDEGETVKITSYRVEVIFMRAYFASKGFSTKREN